jgi:hypothetical protein
LKVNDPYLRERFAGVEQSVRKAYAWGARDPELSACLAGYLVVLISGVYEDCIEYLVNRRASKSNDPELESYVYNRTAQTFRNPDRSSVVGLLGQFSAAYKERFNVTVGSESTDALDSIVNNKNWLAHGDTAKLQVTVADVEGYLARSASVLQALEDILK